MSVTHVEDPSNFSHQIYKNNPILLKRYVNQRVTVITKDESKYSGVVYTIDPVSESVVLLQPKENESTRRRFSLSVVLGHAIRDIRTTSENGDSLPELFQNLPGKITQIAGEERKNAVKKLLLQNRLSVTEKNGVLFVEDAASIEAPYDSDHCISTNAIILTRIQNLLSRICD